MPTNFESQDNSQTLSQAAQTAGAGSDMNMDQGSQIGSQGSQDQQQFSGGQQAQVPALDVLRSSVVGVLDSVVREYEPQIAEFTSNIAHQAVDRGVVLAQSTVQRVKAQSWVRIGVAAALGLGAIAVLAYEAEQMAGGAASEGNSTRAKRTTH